MPSALSGAAGGSSSIAMLALLCVIVSVVAKSFAHPSVNNAVSKALTGVAAPSEEADETGAPAVIELTEEDRLAQIYDGFDWSVYGPAPDEIPTQ